MAFASTLSAGRNPHVMRVLPRSGLRGFRHGACSLERFVFRPTIPGGAKGAPPPVGRGCAETLYIGPEGRGGGAGGSGVVVRARCLGSSVDGVTGEFR